MGDADNTLVSSPSDAEPNREVNVDTKGAIEFDSKEIKPLASKDDDANVSEASSVKIEVESGKLYVAYFYYGEGEGVPTEPPIDSPTPIPTPTANPDRPTNDRPDVEKKVVIRVFDVYGDEPADLRLTEKVT